MSPYGVRVMPRQRRQVSIGPKDSRRPTARRQGLSREQVDGLLQLQGRACALCRRELGERFVVDHDHLLAEQHRHPAEQGCPLCVRGILCPGCNMFLAGFRAEPDFLQRAARYAGRRRPRVRREAPDAS
ncbi:MAG: endonuclease domain-containing protein [Chloroflexota bacterium]